MKTKWYSGGRIGRITIAWLLSVMMMVTFVPVFAFAGTEEDSEAPPQQELDVHESDAQDEAVQDEAVQEGDVQKEAMPAEEGVVKAFGSNDGIGNVNEKGDRSDDITLVLTVEKGEGGSILVNDWVRYSAVATGENVDYIRVYPEYYEDDEYSDDAWYRQREGNRITSDDEWVAYDEPTQEGATNTFMAVAYIGDEPVAYDSEEVTVTAGAEQIGNFSITKVNDDAEAPLKVTVQRGKTLNIEYSPAENATHYWAEVFDDDGFFVEHFGDTGTASGISLNTIELNPGKYSVKVGANAPGYVNKYAANEIELTVNRINIPQGEMYFEVSKGEDEDAPLQTCEEFEYAAFCPGADYIEFFMDYAEDPEWSFDRNGEACSDWNCYRSKGQYVFKAVAHFDNGDVIEAEKNMYVGAKNGELEIGFTDLPLYIVEGNDLEFNVEAENADILKVEASIEDEEEPFYEKEKEVSSWNVVIDTSDINDGEVVRVSVDAWGYGYESAWEEVVIPVIGETSNAVEITAELEKEDGAYVPVLINDDVHVKVGLTNQAPQGTEIKQVILFDGNDYWRNEQVEDGDYHAEISFSEVGTYCVYAKVLLNGEDDEWINCAPIEITVYSNGEIDSFEIASVKDKGGKDCDLDNPITVTRGDTLTVECTEASCGENMSADNYWVEAWRNYGTEEDQDWDCVHLGDSDGPTIICGTVNLEPGTYEVSVSADRVGYESADSENTFTLVVKDMDIDADKLFLEVSKTELLTNEEFTISAYCPDADWIEVFLDENDRGWSDSSEGNSYYSAGDSYEQSGTYTLKAIAWKDVETEGEDGEDYESEEIATATKTITVTAPNGDLNISMPSLPAYIQEGESISGIEVAKPEGADGVCIEAWYEPSADGEDNFLYREETEDDTLLCEIDTSDVAEGATVFVKVSAWGLGYEWSEKEAYIPVVTDSGFSTAIRISAAADTVPVNSDLEIIIEPASDADIIKAVQLFNGREFYEVEEPAYVDGDGVYHGGISFGEDGSHSVYANVKLNNSEEWLTCEPIVITATSEGKAGKFDVISLNGKGAKDINIVSESTVAFKCSESANANHYWLDVDKYNEEEGYWQWVAHGCDTNGPNITFDQNNFNDDVESLVTETRYRVTAKANGEGYTNRDADSSVYITIHDKDSIVKKAAAPATCTASGNVAYWTCSDCGKYFDENGIEIDKSRISIPATGHKWSTIMTDRAGYMHDGTTCEWCSKCGTTRNPVTVPGWANSYVKKLKVAKGKKAITVKWKKQSKKNLKLFNGYEIQVATDPNFTNIVKTATAGKKSKSKKFKGLQKKTVYYVRVRSFTQVGGNRYYSNWTNKTGKTK